MAFLPFVKKLKRLREAGNFNVLSTFLYEQGSRFFCLISCCLCSRKAAEEKSCCASKWLCFTFSKAHHG
jgi:hypothetical protein